MEYIKVHVVKYPDRPRLMMRYRDPDSGKQIARSTGTTKQRAADRAAAKWEAELREGRYNKQAKIAWQEFRQQYNANVLDGLKATTAANYSASLNVFERKMKPGRLAEVTTPKLTAFVTALRADHLTPATIARHLRQLKVAMRWAHRQGLLVKLPEFDMPKQAKGMKGRPISLEEFERMLQAVPRGIHARPSTEVNADDVTRPRPAAILWFPLVAQGHADRAEGTDAPRVDRDDDAVLRRAECRVDGGHPVGVSRARGPTAE